MNIDPVDDCTFWYVNQYVPTTSSAGWRLRVGSFRLVNCSQADLSIVKSLADNNDPARRFADLQPGGNK